MCVAFVAILATMTTSSEEGSSETSPVPSIFEEESFQSQYRVLRTIGRGSNAKVQLAHHRLTGTPVAVKVLQKKKKWCHSVMTEVDIMMMVSHPNIISLRQVIECEKRIYLVMELAEGQQLYQYIRQTGHLQEDEARGIFRQIISAVSYFHELGIVHRDLKPDNIMLNENGKVKIIDFGLGTQVKPGQRLNRHCGAYSFGAPELFLGKLYDGPKIDIWTMGVVLYFMVVGKVPFNAVTIPELRRQVVSGKYPVPSNLSEELRDLLSRLMTVNPRFRPTVTEVMTHPWLREDLEASPNPCEEIVPSLPDPAIVEAMEYMGFQAQDIKDSLHQRKYNQTMASYCLLQEQALQGHGCTTRAQPVNPGLTPFPSLEDPAAFPIELRRRGMLLEILSCPEEAQKVMSDTWWSRRDTAAAADPVVSLWELLLLELDTMRQLIRNMFGLTNTSIHERHRDITRTDVFLGSWRQAAIQAAHYIPDEEHPLHAADDCSVMRSTISMLMTASDEEHHLHGDDCNMMRSTVSTLLMTALRRGASSTR
ncbi:hypothetical protein U0070_026748 [Myodes glareolus]|uniref:non-specific serine/threonine protein kinase n=1 Tax=Myodes glareolus TaxID=447135 RepID=A0AAW0HXF1_MYOGA